MEMKINTISSLSESSDSSAGIMKAISPSPFDLDDPVYLNAIVNDQPVALSMSNRSAH